MAVKISKKSSKPSVPAKSAKKGQKGFTKGISGYPKGRPKGSRNRATLIAQELFGDEIEEIVRQFIEAGKSGDIQVLKFIIGRTLPPMRSAPIEFSLPSIESPSEILKAYDRIWSAVGAGEITLDEMERLKAFLESKQNAIDSVELVTRMENLEIVAGLKT